MNLQASSNKDNPQLSNLFFMTGEELGGGTFFLCGIKLVLQRLITRVSVMMFFL